MKKNIKRFMTLALSTCMVMSSMTGVFASEASGLESNGSAPIFSYKVENVIVPTDLQVAFNPQGLDVTLPDTNTTTDQVISLNYGMLNLGTSDQLVKAEVNLEDKNTEKVIKFVDEDEMEDAGKNDYFMNLKVVPVTSPQAGGAAIDEETTATELADVTGTVEDEDENAVTLTGKNKVPFNLEKADYVLAGDGIELGGTTGNDVRSLYQLDSIGTNGAAAFTIIGSLNTKADWTAIPDGIDINVTYTCINLEDDTSGDREYGLVEATDKEAVVKAGTEAYTIEIEEGIGEGAFVELDGVYAMVSGRETNISVAKGTTWGAAEITDGEGVTTIKLDAKVAKYLGDPVTVKYYVADADGNKVETVKTATVTVATE